MARTLDRSTPFGTRLRAVRLSKGLSQHKLSREANLTDTYINQLESGERSNPSINVVRRIAHALGVAAADLM